MHVCTCILAETDSPEDACGDNCLNRVLMMEWFVIAPSSYCNPATLFM